MYRNAVCFLIVCLASTVEPIWGQSNTEKSSAVPEPSTSKSSAQDEPEKNAKKEPKEEEITAKVTKVIDGDSIKVRTKDGKEYEVQLEGTDAPELKQEYGKESSEALKKMLFDTDVRVSWTKKDNFERPLAQVYKGVTHINAEMIKSGNAWHFKRYNQSQALADLEVEAKTAKRGLWQAAEPKAPWDYRKENRAPDKPDR